jgi:hypothetical protein
MMPVAVFGRITPASHDPLYQQSSLPRASLRGK